MKRFLRLSLTAILGFFVTWFFVKAHSPMFTIAVPEKAPSPGSYIPAKTSVVDAQFNFHLVTPFFWRSAQPDEASLFRMKDAGLKTVINLRRDEANDQWESALAEKMGLNYYYFPMEAEKDHDPAEIDRILEVIQDPVNQPVLVHCAGGKDRSGLIAAIYKIKYTNQDFSDIHKEMLMLGYHQERYPAVLRTLRRWCEIHGRKDIAERIQQDGAAVMSS